MVRIPPPQQLSSVPEIDNGAMGWAANLVDGLGKIRVAELNYGAATVTWPGGQAFSTALQVPHGLTKTPRLMMATVDVLGQIGLTAFPLISVGVGTVGNFQAGGWTIDGQLPVNGSTARFFWLMAL